MKLDIYKLITLLLPIHKRLPNRIAILRMLLYPMIRLWQGFEEYRAWSTYVAGITSQTKALENYLNRKLDNDYKRIRIRHFVRPDTLFFYNENESPEIIYIPDQIYGLPNEDKVYLKYQFEYNDGTTEDFEVDVPSDIDAGLVDNEILKYKLAGKTYQINII